MRKINFRAGRSGKKKQKDERRSHKLSVYVLKTENALEHAQKLLGFYPLGHCSFLSSFRMNSNSSRQDGQDHAKPDISSYLFSSAFNEKMLDVDLDLDFKVLSAYLLDEPSHDTIGIGNGDSISNYSSSFSS